MSHERRFRTIGTAAVRAGLASDPRTGAHATPIYQTSTFLLGSAKLQGTPEAVKPLDTYSRAGNPTVRAVEKLVATLEGCETAVAFASGMAAIAGTLLAHLSHGDEIVYVGPLYGGTQNLLDDVLGKFGVASRRVTSVAEMKTAISPRTRLLYVETPSNPTMVVHSLSEVAALARAHGILSVADNTFATPYLTRPVEHGIDIVLHSATKYLCGHGDLLGGMVAGSAELLTKVRTHGLTNLGATLDPHAAFMLGRGIRTLHLRMEAHCANALAVAEALLSAPGVARVHYPGLAGHPGIDTARAQMRAFGGMLSVDFAAGRPAAAAFIDALELFDHAVSLGDVASLACIPATSTHQSVAPAGQARDGVTPGLVRMSVGIEDVGDLVDDVLRAAEVAAEIEAGGEPENEPKNTAEVPAAAAAPATS